MLPLFVSSPAATLKNTPESEPEISAPAAFERLPPAAIRTPMWLGPLIVPLLATVASPPLMKTPAPSVPAPEISAPAALVTTPPAISATPSSTVAMMLPEFTTVPALPWMMTPSSPPPMEP